MRVSSTFGPSASALRAMLACACLMVLAGCATRPDALVLRPAQLAQPATRTVQILTATNRAAAPGGGYSADHSATTYEQYTISVPPAAELGEVSYPASKPDAATQYIVLERRPLSRQQFLTVSGGSQGRGDHVSVFVHGYNQSFQEALYRLAQTSADSGATSPVILFSWPSEASLLGYVADKDSVLSSRADLTSLLADLGKASPRRQLVVVGHSMGGFLVMEALRELQLSGRRDLIDRMSVALAAPDIDVAVFATQLESIGRLRQPIVLVVSREDQALKVSSILGSDRPRVGRLDVHDPAVVSLIEGFGIVVIDITTMQTPDSFGHEGYATLARYAQSLTNGQEGLNKVAELGLVVLGATQSAILAP